MFNDSAQQRLLLETYQLVLDHLKQFAPGKVARYIHTRQKRRLQKKNYTDILPALAYCASGGRLDESARREDVCRLCACWMLYTLSARIFDDIVDQEGERNPWNKHGIIQALPTGLFFLGVAQTIVSRMSLDGELIGAINDAFGRAIAFAAQAELKSATRRHQQVTLPQYFDNITGKTGVVFGLGAWMGGRLHSRDEQLLNCLMQYGINAGIGGQIIDDCGNIRIDLERGVFTLPIIYATQNDQTLLPHLMVSPARKDSIRQLERAIKRTGALDYARTTAGVFYGSALESVSGLPDTTCLQQYLQNPLE